MTARRRALLRAAVLVELVAVLIGASVSLLLGGPSAAGFFRGGISGALIAAPLFLLDLVLLGSRRGRAIRRLPFGVAIAARSVAQFALIVLALTGAALLTGASAGAFLNLVTVSVAVAVSVTANFLWQLNRYLGPGVLFALVTGRYRHPRVEDRVFLFLDLAGSTSAAERLGPIRFMSLLDEIAYDVADPVMEGRGEIHRYVGDEIIVTWRADQGVAGATCVTTCFAMLAAICARADWYQRTFGFVPAFHAALHVGPAVIAEIGDIHREIALLGDAVNATARIEAESSARGEAVLASGELLARVTLPAGVVARPLGAVPLRGRALPIALSALESV